MKIEFIFLLCGFSLVVGALISGFIAFKKGILYRKRTAEAAIGSAEKEAERLPQEVIRQIEYSKN
jgi:ribonuclease Y